MHVAKDWNPKQNLFNNLIMLPEKFDEAMALCKEMHSLLHTSQVTGATVPTYLDDLYSGLDDNIFRIFTSDKNTSISWNIWHITRIEDITGNILLENEVQVLNDDWCEKMNVKIKETGNAMTVKDIIDFSNSVNIEALKNYRNAVGLITVDILNKLEPSDIKRKFTQEQLDRIIHEEGVTADSIWLVDFWGRKNVAGILRMPMTRHQITHLNDSMIIKKRYSDKV